MFTVKHTITQNWTDTCAQQCSDAHNIEYHRVKLHRHLQTCIQWSIQLQNWTDTCAQQCSDAYNIEYHKLHRHLQTCIRWSIQLQNWTETCSSAMMHTILNITESNCTDTYRHVYSEAYNMNISQSQTTQTLTDMYAVKHTITKLNRDLCTAVQWCIQYWISVKLHRHLQTCMHWSLQMQSGIAPVDTRLTFSDIPCVPPAWGRPSPPGWWPPAHSSPPALSPSGAHLRSRLSPSCTQVPSWVISVL